MAIPVDQMPIGEGLHPNGEPDASFFIDRPTLDLIEKEGPEWKFDDARFIRETVSDPDSVFEGLKRANHADCFCYCVRPTHDPDEPGAPEPLFLEKVFVVFVRPGVGGYVVFDWAWRQHDPDEPWHPRGWQTDFTRRTWIRP
jgi:hypothetical protein